ncbi:MAG: hypothetical protein CVV27_17770, partial [Candidatus Melainabacteria bacterium HGW-Melainabacteria-1]
MLVFSGCGAQVSSLNQGLASQQSLSQALSKQPEQGRVTQLKLTSQTAKTGQLALSWQSPKAGFAIQSTQADIQQLQINLAGEPIESVNQGSALNLSLNFAQGSHAIRNIPAGTIDISVTAYGANGEVLGTASASGVAIVAGQVSSVQLSLQLQDTVIVEQVSNTGDLALGLAIQDGQNVVQQEQVAPLDGYLQHAPPPPGAIPPGEPVPPPPGSDCPLPPPPPPEVIQVVP